VVSLLPWVMRSRLRQPILLAVPQSAVGAPVDSLEAILRQEHNVLAGATGVQQTANPHRLFLPERLGQFELVDFAGCRTFEIFDHPQQPRHLV
jgi:hypothetical protein